MWFNLLSMGIKAGTHIYKNKQQTKMLMSDAQMRNASAMAKGEMEYKGKLLEANFVIFYLTDMLVKIKENLPHNCICQVKN